MVAITNLVNLDPISSVFIKKLLLQQDITDRIYWNEIPGAFYYKVYDAQFNVLYQGTSSQCYIHGRSKSPRLYYVSWVGSGGESSLISIHISNED